LRLRQAQSRLAFVCALHEQRTPTPKL